MVNTTDADSIPQYDVFISYSHKDKDVARQLIHDLESHHIAGWWDELISHGIGRDTPGWIDQIEYAIDNTQCMVVILSPNSKRSEWMDNEIAYAQTRQKTIFPVLVDGDPQKIVPINLIRAQRIDLRDSQGIAQLVKAINKLLGRITETQETEVVPPAPSAPPPATSKPVDPSPRRLHPLIIFAIFLIGVLILSLVILTTSQPQADTITSTLTLPSIVDYEGILKKTVTSRAQTELTMTRSPSSTTPTNTLAIPSLPRDVYTATFHAWQTAIALTAISFPTVTITPTPNYSATIAARVQATLAAQQTATAEAIVTSGLTATTATPTPTSDVTPTPNYSATIAARVQATLAAQQTATAEVLGTP